MSDRTVHGAGVDDMGHEYVIVRYNRAGAWWQETRGVGHRRITVDEAVALTQVHYANRPGGRIFDARVRKAATP